MTFERTRDYELVRSIITHPRIYPHVSDDFSPAPAEFHPAEHEAIWYVLVRDGGELLGLFMFVPESQIVWQVHTCLLPIAWGDRAAAAARGVAEWIWQHTSCRRITTAVPGPNKLALRFARAAGMSEYGLNPRACLKGGELHDIHLLGMSRPEES